MEHSDRIITLNVGGKRYQTYISTLSQYPETLLGTMFANRNSSMLKETKKREFFFDRDGDLFQVVINFYRTGNVHIPPNFSQEAVSAELDFFRIPYEHEVNTKHNAEDYHFEYGYLTNKDKQIVLTHTNGETVITTMENKNLFYNKFAVIPEFLKAVGQLSSEGWRIKQWIYNDNNDKVVAILLTR